MTGNVSLIRSVMALGPPRMLADLTDEELRPRITLL